MKKWIFFLGLAMCQLLTQAQTSEEIKELQDTIGQQVFTFVEQMPEFPGGQKELDRYFKKNLEYPEVARKQKIEGRVVGRFVVMPDGSIKGIEILKSVSPEIDAEFIRVVKAMPHWLPGKQNGKTVPVSYVLPVTFRL